MAPNRLAIKPKDEIPLAKEGVEDQKVGMNLGRSCQKRLRNFEQVNIRSRRG